MTLTNTPNASGVSSGKKKFTTAMLIAVMSISGAISEAAAGVADVTQVMNLAARLPLETPPARRQSDIEEAAGAAISSVRGIVTLMKQAQELSAMLPSREKTLTVAKSDGDAALSIAAKLPAIQIVQQEQDPPKPSAPAPAKSQPAKQTQVAAKPPSARAKVALPGSQNLIWPVNGVIYSAFNSPRGRRRHGAIDIVTQKGVPIAAAADGVVSVAANGGKNFSGYGKIVILDHGKGLYTVYAHCDSINVKMGQRVRQGEYIAAVGRTGRATTNHCHFEVRIAGQKYDPLAYLPSRPSVVKAAGYKSSGKK